MERDKLVEFIKANPDHEVIVLCEVCGTDVVFVQRFAATEFNADTFKDLPDGTELPTQVITTESGSKHLIIGETEKDVS